MSNYNYAAAFLAFCKGVELQEIADTMAIPLNLLESRWANEKWPAMAKQMAVELAQGSAPMTRLDTKTEARLAMIEENRRRNFEMFDKLRQDFVKQVEALLDETLRMEKSWHNKGTVVTHIVEPTTGDRVNLATYARTIAEGTYAALGDRVSGLGAKEGAGDGAPPPPGVTIILPGAIASPRQERDVTPKGVVIDMREKVPQIVDVQEVAPARPTPPEAEKAQQQAQ